MARHTGQAELLTGEWHVGLSLAGMFPAIEQSCPCPKAACGLAAPDQHTVCPWHQSTRYRVVQGHHESECASAQRRHRKARRTT